MPIPTIAHKCRRHPPAQHPTLALSHPARRGQFVWRWSCDVTTARQRNAIRCPQLHFSVPAAAPRISATTASPAQGVQPWASLYTRVSCYPQPGFFIFHFLNPIAHMIARPQKRLIAATLLLLLLASSRMPRRCQGAPNPSPAVAAGSGSRPALEQPGLCVDRGASHARPPLSPRIFAAHRHSQAAPTPCIAPSDPPH